MNELCRAWVRFWFELSDTRALDLVRVGVGLTLFVSYVSLAGHVDAFYTEQGWLPLDRTPSLDEESTSLSVLFWFRGRTAAWAVWGLTVAAAAVYTVGWRANVVKFLLFIGHYSLTRRAPPIAYGVDDLCSNLLFIQCLVPMGHALAVGRRPDLMHPRPGWSRTLRSLGLRLTQVQMTIIMAFAGLEKLQGEDWWDGLGVWYAMTDWEFNFAPLTPFAEHAYLLNALGYGAVLFELAYPVLIWNRRLRVPLLIAAVFLHLGVAALMGLWLFSAAMLASHMAFAPPSWFRRWGLADGDCSAPQNGFDGSDPRRSSSSNTATEGHRAPGSMDNPRARAR